MTFSHGDYAGVEIIENKQAIAEKLHRRSLKYLPNERAYLGLGMLLQQKRDFRASIGVLKEGIERFPKNEQLHVCAGISYMNLGKFSKAVVCFSRVERSETIESYITECHRQMK